MSGMSSWWKNTAVYVVDRCVTFEIDPTQWRVKFSRFIRVQGFWWINVEWSSYSLTNSSIFVSPVWSTLCFTCSLKLIFPIFCPSCSVPACMSVWQSSFEVEAVAFREQYNLRLQKLNLCRRTVWLWYLSCDGIVSSCRKGAFGGI